MIAGGLLLLWFLKNWATRRARVRYLREKYQNEGIVQKILANRIWIGQTADQLTDSIGHSVTTDHKLLKTKSRDIWKYRRKGVNRYGLRITVEDGYVTAWDSKSN